jgi:hypothetical protein
MSYLIAASATSVLFVAAGWRRRPVAEAAPISLHRLGLHVILPDGVSGPASAGQARDDVAAAIYLALARLAPVIARQSVKIDVAVNPRLYVRTRGPLLAEILEELLTVALQAAPACRLLLTGVSDGDRVYIGISDDMPGGDAAVRLGRVVSLTRRLKLEGDSLRVDVRPNEGTTMTLRLAGSGGGA